MVMLHYFLKESVALQEPVTIIEWNVFIHHHPTMWETYCFVLFTHSTHVYYRLAAFQVLWLVLQHGATLVEMNRMHE